jgi:hypothetical protein
VDRPLPPSFTALTTLDVAAVALRDTLAMTLDVVAACTGPSKHKLYGISMKWRTTVDEAPRGLEPSDFEDWLWKREKPKHPGQLADFRSRATSEAPDLTPVQSDAP